MCNFLNYEGSVKIDGIEIKSINPKDLAKKITILPQQINMYFDYKVRDVVKFGRYAHSKWKFWDKKESDHINEILKDMNIYHLKDKYMSELSGGECQKVFIARVLAQNSDIILLDELSNNLDINSQIYMVQNINRWFKDKILISVFHDLNLIRNLDNRVMVIKNSKIYKYGDVDSIFTRDNLKNIYGVDIQEFMISSLEKWQCRKKIFNIRKEGNEW